ncbi:MAG: hypothetical protein U9Q06_01855 [Nanoarchaeota archaeon]|nr:hypothetical protein [Nanoarchaeota archaeon]
MNLEELKRKLDRFDISEIKRSYHAFERIQDKRRKINYPKIRNLLITQNGLYKFQEQLAKYPNELKFKLWFKLNYIFDMNIYIVINKEINSISESD